MAINKNFVVKNGFKVNTNLILAGAGVNGVNKFIATTRQILLVRFSELFHS